MFHSDICCNFPVVEMNEFHQKVTKGKGFVILGAEVCVVYYRFMLDFCMYACLQYVYVCMYVCVHTIRLVNYKGVKFRIMLLMASFNNF